MLTVENVDFDPEKVKYLHAEVDRGGFNTMLRESIRNSGLDKRFRDQAANAISSMAGTNYRRPDLEALTTDIAAGLKAQYQAKGLVLMGQPLATATDLVRAALIEHLPQNRRMTEGEVAGFKELLELPGVERSRAKGKPTTVPFTSLPSGLRGNVDRVLRAIRRLKAKYTKDYVDYYEYARPGYFEWAVQKAAKADGGLSYQGNHTNNAGWLPPEAIPTARMPEVAEAAARQATPPLDGLLRSWAELSPPDDGTALNLLRAAIASLADGDVGDSAIIALCQGESAYIEFNMPGDISRLIYEPTHGRVYLSAHYKWLQGYNPFFEITGAPAT